jgi:hypothetical protein
MRTEREGYHGWPALEIACRMREEIDLHFAAMKFRESHHSPPALHFYCSIRMVSMYIVPIVS